jgi:citrate lyase subunit beta/citryl-CoA lyase
MRHFPADLDAVPWDAVAGGMLPKAERPEDIRRLEAAGARRIIFMIETAAGMAAFDGLAAASSRNERCALGNLDLALDLGLLAVDDVDESELMWHVRAALVLNSRAAGLHAPIDGVSVRLGDEAGLRRTCERVYRLGYSGKLLIHPKQIAVTNAVFKLNPDDVELAREIVDAYAVAEREGRGALQVRGRMVDRPVVERARRQLERWVNPKA